MNDSLRLSRRGLIVAGATGLSARRPWAPAQPVLAVRQTGAAPWRIADGLRLAGPVSGLPSLDPARSRDLATNFLLRQLFRGLVMLDVDLQPRPEIAESVVVSSDGLVHDFVIRESARFHDGRPITPDDVQFSLSRSLDPRTTGGSLESLAGVTYLRDIQGAAEQLGGRSDRLAGVAITGERTLSITLDQPSATFLMRLASVPASIVDARQVDEDDDWVAAPNGSGPFAVVSWDPASSIEFAAADSWWSGKPAVPRIGVRLGSTASQPINLFQGGDIDLVDDVPPELVDLIQDPATGTAIGELIATGLFATSYIAFGNRQPPLDDPHLRKALQYVFPASLIASSSFNGQVNGADGLLPPGLLGADWPISPLVSDVDAAWAELRASRYGTAANVPPIAIYAADIASVEALRDVAGQELGLRIEAIQVGWSDFLTGLAERRFPAYALYWGADFPDPESLVDTLFGEGSPENFTGYVNPGLELLLAEAREASAPERIEVYARANQLLVDDAALIPLYHPIGYTLARPGLGGVATTPMGILGLETIAERR